MAFQKNLARIVNFPRIMKEVLKNNAFSYFAKHVEYVKSAPFPKVNPTPKTDQYWELERELFRIRKENDYKESPEEIDVLDDMEMLWYTLSIAEQIEINDAPLNFMKRPN